MSFDDFDGSPYATRENEGRGIGCCGYCCGIYELIPRTHMVPSVLTSFYRQSPIQSIIYDSTSPKTLGDLHFSWKGGPCYVDSYPIKAYPGNPTLPPVMPISYLLYTENKLFVAFIYISWRSDNVHSTSLSGIPLYSHYIYLFAEYL